MRARSISAVVAALVVGVVGGGAAAYVDQPSAGGSGAPTPIRGADPAFPTSPVSKPPTVEPDLDTPALTTPTAFTKITVTSSLATWRFVKPKGWQAWCIGQHGAETQIPDDQVQSCASSGVYFRPVGEPTVGGYSMRVQLVSDHQAPVNMETAKRKAIEDSPTYREVQVLDESPTTLSLSLLTPQYGTPGYLFRYNYFRWFAASDDTSEATLEMSVSGRKRDAAGLTGLFQEFAQRTRSL